MMTLRNLIASATLLLAALGPLAAAAQTGGEAPAIKPPVLAPRPAVPDLKPAPMAAPRIPNVPVVPLDGKRLAKGEDDEKGRRGRRSKRSAKRDAPGALAQRDADRGTEKTPRWRQVEDDDEPERPTLSADFIKNCKRLRPGVKVHLDIYDEDLEAVVKLIACMTGKNIILADSLKGKKITIYSPTLVTVAEAERAFYTALDANGYTVSRRGQFLKIIPSKDYQSQPDGIIPPGANMPPNLDRMETRIVPLRYVDAQEITEVLSKLASPNASFIAYSPTNSLIITELSSNLRKLLELIQMLDVEGSEEQVWIYQVLNADAQDIAQKILEIFEDRRGGGGGGAARRPRAASSKSRRSKRSEPTATAVGESDTEVSVSKVVADERTNRLIIVATARSYRRIKRLIARLDVAIPGDGQVHIHQLHHAKAEDLANVLSNLSQNAQQRQAGRRPARRSRRASKGKDGGGGGGDSSAVLFEGEVSITADEDTNTLVITSSLKDYLSLKNVIEVLDRPRRQVFIEAVVMEVSIRNDRKFGLGFHGALEGPTVAGEGVPLIIGHRPGELNTLNLASAATLQGLAVAAIGPSKTIAGLGEIPSFGAILRALATSNDSNILSTPHILTTDNEEAEIVVGQNVPFVSGFVGGAGALQGLGNNNNLGGLGGLGGFFPSVSVQRQDVALTLKITPRINDEDFVTLEVEQVIEEVDSIDPVVGPTTSKRSVKTTVVVKDQNTVVIGGLQRSQQLNSESKVPILGEIPVIGYLFRDTTKTRERRNLLLLLTPHVIEGPDDFRTIFKRKLEEHREFVARFHKKGDVFVVGIDYGKKHGALEAIHQSLKAAREEEELLERLRRQQDGPPLPQDVDGVPIEGDLPPRPSGVIDGEIGPAEGEGAGDGDGEDAAGPSPVPPPVEGPLGQAPIEEGDRL